MLSLTLPNVWTHHPLRDALFFWGGGVGGCCLTAIPILPPAVGFPVPYTLPACSSLNGPLKGKMREEGLMKEGVGSSHVHARNITSLHVSAPPAHFKSETSCSRGAALHSCITLHCWLQSLQTLQIGCIFPLKYSRYKRYLGVSSFWGQKLHMQRWCNKLRSQFTWPHFNCTGPAYRQWVMWL